MKFFNILLDGLYVRASFGKMVLSFIALTTLLATIIAARIFHYSDKESILNFVVAWPLNETQWSESYEQKAYESISFGFAREDVIRRIGEPLEKQIHSDGEIWHYACAKVAKGCRYFSKPYHRRDISFDKNGLVQHVWYEYWID